MSFAGLLGAGLLGGVANAAKGVGDKLREEAKQKRAMALVDQAQANAVALQEEVAEDNIEQAKQEGKITIAVDDNTAGNTSDLLAQKGDIAAAAAVVTQANNITNLNAQGDIAKDLAKLQSELNKGEAANKATLDDLRVKLEASIAAKAASQLAIVNAESAAQQASVAATTAEKLAGTQMDMAVYDTATNKDVAAALVASQTKTAAKLSETRMAELTANNLAAIENIKVAKVNDVQGFYNMTTGTEQMHVLDKDGNWIPKGGPKAIPAASKGSYTFENVVIDGKEVTGYLKDGEFIVVGAPVDDDTKNSNSWDAEKVTKFANKQSWLQMGLAVDKYGSPVGNIGPKERALVSANTAAIVKAWKADTSVDLATVMDNVFTGKTTGSTGGSTPEAKDLSDGQRAIDAGNRTVKQVVDALKQKYPNIDTSGLTAKK
jgi:hypothetical protein